MLPDAVLSLVEAASALLDLLLSTVVDGRGGPPCRSCPLTQMYTVMPFISAESSSDCFVASSDSDLLLLLIAWNSKCVSPSVRRDTLYAVSPAPAVPKSAATVVVVARAAALANPKPDRPAAKAGAANPPVTNSNPPAVTAAAPILACRIHWLLPFFFLVLVGVCRDLLLLQFELQFANGVLFQGRHGRQLEAQQERQTPQNDRSARVESQHTGTCSGCFGLCLLLCLFAGRCCSGLQQLTAPQSQEQDGHKPANRVLFRQRRSQGGGHGFGAVQEQKVASAAAFVFTITGNSRRWIERQRHGTVNGSGGKVQGIAQGPQVRGGPFGRGQAECRETEQGLGVGNGSSCCWCCVLIFDLRWRIDAELARAYEVNAKYENGDISANLCLESSQRDDNNDNSEQNLDSFAPLSLDSFGFSDLPRSLCFGFCRLCSLAFE